MDHNIVVADSRQEGLVREDISKHLQVCRHYRLQNVPPLFQRFVVSQSVSHEVSIQNNSVKIFLSFVDCLKHILNERLRGVLPVNAQIKMAGA